MTGYCDWFLKALMQRYEMYVQYLKNNLILGIKTPPVRGMRVVLPVFAVFAVSSVVIGGVSGLFVFKVVQWKAGLLILPLTMFVFPAFLEEAFFRGILIPNAAVNRSGFSITGLTLLSAVIFTLWHPFNAFLFNPTARLFFFDVRFLTIVFLLGITCSISYIYSRSLWVPVFIHWVTILIWVFLLGGHNLVAKALAV